jgi:hypothetical protein
MESARAEKRTPAAVNAAQWRQPYGLYRSFFTTRFVQQAPAPAVRPVMRGTPLLIFFLYAIIMIDNIVINFLYSYSIEIFNIPVNKKT